MDWEALRMAEEFFFTRKPEAVETVRMFLHGVLERWPETEIVTQKSQVGVRCPRPFCALWVPGKRIRGKASPGAALSLFLPRPLETERLIMAVEPYPGRFTNHLLLSSPEEVDEELFLWTAEAKRFRCGGLGRK